MLRFICVLFLMLLSLHFQLRSQDFRAGYIVKNLDTIPGLIANRQEKVNGISCLFKKTKNDKQELYLPTQIEGFGIFGYKQYERKKLTLSADSVQNVFVEVLVKGELNLYSYNKVFYIEKDSLVQLEPKIQIKAGKKIISSKYIGSLNYAMRDCRQNNDKVEYNEDALTATIVKYNECKGTASMLVKKGTPNFKLRGVLLAGIDLGQVKLQGLEKFSYVKSYSVPVGLGIRFSFPRVNDRIYGLMDVFYDSKLYQTYSETQVNSTLTRADYLFKYSSIRIPLGIQYNISHESSTFNIKGGLIYSLVMDLDGKVAIENETNGIVYPDVTDYNFTRKNANGFWIGSGYQHKIFNNLLALVDVRYEVNSGFTNPTPSSKSRSTNLSLIMGIIF